MSRNKVISGRIIIMTVFSWLMIVAASAQTSLSADAIALLARRHASLILDEYFEFLRLPNDARRPEQLEPNLRWLEQSFGRRGFTMRRLANGGIDLVLAERRVSGARRTVLFYLHVDGQPVDSSRWQQESPYVPVLKRMDADGQWNALPWEALRGTFDPEWRIFARSAADDKGPIAMLLAAWDALTEAGQLPAYNVKVIFDPEEEIGSHHLPAAVEQYGALLQADALVILDGPMHLSNRPTLIFGGRGNATVTLTTYGPRAPQHSGHYGNYAPNPALQLTRLLASMKDDAGRVTIPGFYDGIELDAATQASLAAVPDDEQALRRRLGIAGADSVGANLQEALQYPSLNIRGLNAGWVGDEARTIIPDAAVAELDIRLVRESDPRRLLRLLREHIEGQGFHLIDGEPTEAERLNIPRLIALSQEISYTAFRTDMDTPVGRWLAGALTRTFGEPPVRIRTMGGSVPIAPFIDVLRVPAVILPLVNSDNNQHSPNENLRLGNYLDGVRTLIGVLNTPLE
jgi:acetylornithine deacetylase/succinyl-diaminopimelate desuccinylase-like protein